MGADERTGGVSKQMKSRYFGEWLWPHFTAKDLEEIVLSHANPQKQMIILNNVLERADLPDSFTEDIYVDEKRQIIKEVEARAVMEDEDLHIKQLVNVYGFPAAVEYEVEQKEEEKKIIKLSKGTLKQKSAKGKEYTRTYHRWSMKEQLYLKSRRDDIASGKIKLSEVKEGLKRLSGVERTNDSINTKVRRIKKGVFNERET